MEQLEKQLGGVEAELAKIAVRSNLWSWFEQCRHSPLYSPLALFAHFALPFNRRSWVARHLRAEQQVQVQGQGQAVHGLPIACPARLVCWLARGGTAFGLDCVIQNNSYLTTLNNRHHLIELIQCRQQTARD